MDADSETSEHTNTKEILLMRRKFQHRPLFTFQRMINDRCKSGKISRMTRPNTEWDFIISRTSTFWKWKIWELHMESSRPDFKISEIQTHQHSRKGLSNGPWAWTEKQGKLLGFHTRTCTKFKVRILGSKHVLQNRSREQCFFTFYTYVEKVRNHCWLGRFTSYDDS